MAESTTRSGGQSSLLPDEDDCGERTRGRDRKTVDRPTMKSAMCPVCDTVARTTQRFRRGSRGRLVPAEKGHRFPAHKVPGFGHLCCESGDPVANSDFRRAGAVPPGQDPARRRPRRARPLPQRPRPATAAEHGPAGLVPVGEL